MRFRSLVVSWCVCAIHGSVQIASGHRSLDATSRSSYHPPAGDIETLFVRSLRNISNLLSSVPSLPMFRPHSPSRHLHRTVDAISKPVGVEEVERIGRRRILLKLMKRVTVKRMKVVEPFAKSKSRHGQRKKCRYRKWDDRRKESSLSRSKAPGELNESPAVKSLFTFVCDTNVRARILNPISESTAETSTTPQGFTDIAFTPTDAVPSTVNAITITDAARITAKEVGDATHETYWSNFPRQQCKKIKCTSKNCKKKRKREMNVIDVLILGFFSKM